MAEFEQLPVIDIYATAAHPDYFHLDGLHPNTAGTRMIAETAYASLQLGKELGRRTGEVT